MNCDLHTHSTASDGTIAPGDLATLASKAGLRALALTDHDTTQGLRACAAACEAVGIDFVPGIEVSADIQPCVRDEASSMTRGTLHILGLFIDPDAPALATIHQRMLHTRSDRNQAIIRRLNSLGIDIHYDEVVELAQREGTHVIGRPHIGQLLVHKGHAHSVSDAFLRYIGSSARGYARRDYLHPADAIDAIHQAGGLALLAHPVQLRCDDDAQLDHAMGVLRDAGIDGLEAWHPDHRPGDIDRFRALARSLNLLITGGSDYHGSRKPTALGCMNVPLDIYHQLQHAITTRQ